jgi:hypothetical protein
MSIGCGGGFSILGEFEEFGDGGFILAGQRRSTKPGPIPECSLEWR